MDMMKRIPVELQDPEIRKNNFNEVSLGYNKAEAIAEATRCLQCKNKPCVGGCPVAIDIPAFILKIKEEKFEEAYQIIKKSSNLSAVCGRVCPQEIQCEKRCIRGIKGEAIAIGRLER
ncbi:MAG: dihydropyrimidine dehydrogenase, partial [Bacilli bacterium]